MVPLKYGEAFLCLSKNQKSQFYAYIMYLETIVIDHVVCLQSAITATYTGCNGGFQTVPVL